jgi:hypothetical protein
MWGADDLVFLSRYDGLSDFRLTPLGAYVLGLDASYKPVAIPSSLVLSVLPSLQVNVLRGSPGAEEALLLENWAEPVQTGSWLLNRERALSAIEKGYDIAELRNLLESRDDMPLPDSVEAFIRQRSAAPCCLSAVTTKPQKQLPLTRKLPLCACAVDRKRWLSAPST